MNLRKAIAIASLSLLTLPLTARAADVIELPEEELAKESVLPVFTNPMSVRNRAIVTDGRVDMNLFYGLALSEPIYDVSRLGVSLYYNTSENHAFGVIYAKNGGGLSSYAKQLHDKYQLDFKRAPAPSNTALFDWDWKMYYGKMSISKATNLRFNIYTTMAAGMVQYVHKSYPAIAPGIGEKFYFGRHLALRFDLRLFMHQAPIPFYVGDATTGLQDSKTAPAYNSFEERMTFTTVLDAGLSWLF